MKRGAGARVEFDILKARVFATLKARVSSAPSRDRGFSAPGNASSHHNPLLYGRILTLIGRIAPNRIVSFIVRTIPPMKSLNNTWFWLLIAASCSAPSSSEQTADTLAQVHPDSVVELNAGIPSEAVADTQTEEQSASCEEQVAEWDEQLNTNFTPEQGSFMRQARLEFCDIGTAAQLAAFYFNTMDSVVEVVNKQIALITPTETSGDDSPDATWSWLPSFFPVYYGSVDCSECTYDTKISMGPFVEKAKATPEPEDDLFFEAAALMPDNWYTLEGCDFCAASNMGDGIRVQILDALASANAARPAFGKKMDEFLAHATSTDTFDNTFSRTKEEVLKELDAMIKHRVITTEQKNALKELRGTLSEAGQYDCATKNCFEGQSF